MLMIASATYRPVIEWASARGGLHVLALACGLVSACGRYHFDAITGANADLGDAAGDVAFDAGDRPNVVFATSTTTAGSFGGVNGADAICQAAGAGLGGQFRAWISDSGVDAKDRLAGSRGWVRVDGEPIADTIDDMINQRFLNPIDVDETGAHVPDSNVWTGTGGGLRDTFTGTCSDWTSNAASVHGRVDATYQVFGVIYPNSTCDLSSRLLCFEVGHQAVVTAKAHAGRIAFISKGRTMAGLAGLDQQCQTDANDAHLGGTYAAAVATSTGTIASRFPTLDATPYRRVDGTIVSADGPGLFGNRLVSFIHQRADGWFVVGNILTGANDVASIGMYTCADWTDLLSGVGEVGVTGTLETGPPYGTWASISGSGCNAALPVVCLQQ
jgi:hypothetical protein